MIYLLTLLTLLSFGILIVLFLKNMELKEQINKSLEENADNLSDQISFQSEKVLLRQTNWNDKAIESIADGTISTVDRYPRGFTSKFV